MAATRLKSVRSRLLLLGVTVASLCFTTGCYSEFMGPAAGGLTLVDSQPGGSFRSGSINRTEYTVHLFWGIWTPKKTNSWKTLQTEMQGRHADGAYNVEIETYMPWWHIFPAWWTGGIVDISAHTIRADTYAYSKSDAPPAAPVTAPLAAPSGTAPASAPPSTAPAKDPTPTTRPPEQPLIQGTPENPDQAAPRPGRDPNNPTAPAPVAGPDTPAP